MLPKEPVGHGMKSARPGESDVPLQIPDNSLRSPCHFGGGAPCEGQQQDPFGIDALEDKVRHTMRECIGFTRTGTGNHEQGACGFAEPMFGRLALAGVELMNACLFHAGNYSTFVRSSPHIVLSLPHSTYVDRYRENRRRPMRRSLFVVAAAASIAAGAHMAAQNPAPAGGGQGGRGQQAPPQPMSFFVTSVGVGDGANLGGLAGADAHCQKLAVASGREGAASKTWHAYLSTQGNGAVNA